MENMSVLSESQANVQNDESVLQTFCEGESFTSQNKENSFLSPKKSQRVSKKPKSYAPSGERRCLRSNSKNTSVLESSFLSPNRANISVIAEPVTPRRSARKSIMPPLDYLDIVNSARRAQSPSTETCSTQRWTPANVGRGRKKRRPRRVPKKVTFSEVLAESVLEDEEEADTTTDFNGLNDKTDDDYKIEHDQVEEGAKQNPVEPAAVKSALTQNEAAVGASEISDLSVAIPVEVFKEKETVGIVKEVEADNENGIEEEGEEFNEVLVAEAVENLAIDNAIDVRVADVISAEHAKDIDANLICTESSVICIDDSGCEDPQETTLKPTKICPPKFGGKLQIDVDLGVRPLDDDDDEEEEEFLPSLCISEDEEQKPVAEDMLNTTFDADSSLNEPSPQKQAAVSQPKELKIVLTNVEQENTLLYPVAASPVNTPTIVRSNTFDLTTPATLKRGAPHVPKGKLSQSGQKPSSAVKSFMRMRTNSVTIVSSNGVSNVSLFSPARPALVIEDVDKMNLADTSTADANVTMRRKRSISAETLSTAHSQIRKPTLSSTKTFTRTKLPNFSLIHAKHFNQLENVVEHLERRDERAKMLIGSGMKPRLESIKKDTKIGKPALIDKPKAAKKIKLNTCGNEGSTETDDAVNDELFQQSLPKPRLPTPRKAERKFMSATLKRPMKATSCAKSNLASRAASNILKAATKSGIPLSTAAKQNERKVFSFATVAAKVVGSTLHIKGKPNVATKCGNKPETLKMQQVSNKPAITASGSKPIAPANAKVASLSHKPIKSGITSANLVKPVSVAREQQHVQLFKQRTETSTTTKNNDEKSKAQATNVLCGVRKNRRFELQMKHRKKIESTQLN